MGIATQKLYLEQLERRDCPSAAVVVTPPGLTADLTKLTTDLNKAAVDFVNKAPAATEINDTLAIMADTAKLAFDLRANTHASFGGMLAPLISLEIDEATLYYDFATGNTAGAQAAATKELTDLQSLGTALTGTANPGLSADVISQAFAAFNHANNTLFGIGGSGGGGGSGSGIPAA